jgi:flagellar M-ring protein FliF
MNSWWNTLSTRARLSFCGAAAAVLLLAGVAGWWLLRTEPAALFTDLRPQDAAALSAELDKLKVPYSVADSGTTLLVDKSQVHAVRLKLMGRELPLQGTVGLELFNSTDFGMTEFAQKINFQRALQGELTRTILSFPEIRDARVHLVLPEQGLFKQNTGRAKAAVTLGLRRGQALRPEQVLGIQRLVAASVPALAPQEVTIVDQQGIPLSRSAEGESEASGSSRLDLKKETESYLARKATAVLEQALGVGQAMAAIDVTLNMDQVRVTTEDVIPATEGKGGGATGVLVRERESARDNAAGNPRGTDAAATRGSSMQRDVEYQAGRRVEQVFTQPGAIRRIQVVAVVREDLDRETQEHVERLLAAAVGVSPERGDVVVVRGLHPRPAWQGAQAMPAAENVAQPPAVAPSWPWLLWASALLPLFAGVLLLRLRSRRVQVRVLNETERRVALQRVQAWMLEAAETAPVPVHQTGARE